MYKIQNFILASTSRARIDILKKTKIEFSSQDSFVDESQIVDLDPKHKAFLRAKAKALAVASKKESTLVLGCDQTLSLKNRSFDKPHNYEEAQEQLLFLSGKTHQLHSAYVFAIQSKDGPFVLSKFSGTSSVSLSLWPLKLDEIKFYLNHYSWLGSVGSYQIENGGVQIVRSLDGDVFTVMGLPVFCIISSLRALGINPILQHKPPWTIDLEL